MTDTNSLEEQQRILNEYITKADTLDDKIEVMRDEKTLTNDFNRYLEKSFGSTNNRKDNNNDNNPREEIGTSSITEKNKNARRATRA